MLWVPATVGRFRTASRTFASIPGSFDSTTADHVCNLRINFVDSRLGACRFRRLGSKWVRVAQGEKMAISATHAAGRSNRLGPIGRGGGTGAVSYTHLRAHETGRNLVCRLLL